MTEFEDVLNEFPHRPLDGEPLFTTPTPLLHESDIHTKGTTRMEIEPVPCCPAHAADPRLEEKIVKAVFGQPGDGQKVTTIERKDEPGKRFDAGKLRFDLIPAEWEKGLAEVLTRGAAKYAERNWERGMSWSRCYAAVRRHLNAFWRGEDTDPESGLPHLLHVAWGALALTTYAKTHPELDDRVKS